MSLHHTRILFLCFWNSYPLRCKYFWMKLPFITKKGASLKWWKSAGRQQRPKWGGRKRDWKGKQGECVPSSCLTLSGQRLESYNLLSPLTCKNLPYVPPSAMGFITERIFVISQRKKKIVTANRKLPKQNGINDWRQMTKVT